jgi:hypothetical protein
MPLARRGMNVDFFAGDVRPLFPSTSMSGARTAPHRFCHWPAKAISANTGRQTRTRETDHPSPDAVAEPLFHLLALSLTQLDAGPTPHVTVEPTRLYAV